MTTFFARSACVALLLLGACSSKDPVDPTPGGGSGGAGSGGSGGSGGGGGAPGLFGSFIVEFRAEDALTGVEAFSAVRGRVHDGPVPETTPMKAGPEDNGCRLLKPDIPFCDPPCGGGSETKVCVAGGKCVAYPKAQSVGSMQVVGLAGGDFAMEPNEPKLDYQSSALPYPACDEGAWVSVRSNQISMQAACIAPLTLQEEPISVRREAPVSVTWNVPGQADLARVLIRLDVSHHGGKKGEIDCDVPDTGAFEIPEALVTQLVDLGLAGFPTISVTRSVSAPSEEEENVTLSVAASIERVVDTGVVSCTKDEDCPTGQSCDVDLTCK